MAKVGAQRAAILTGRSKSTVQRAMNTGKLSYENDPNGRRVVDVSELERVFGLQKPEKEKKIVGGEVELERASSMLEMERMRMRIKMLETQLEMNASQIDDLRDQRDQWQKQASQVLITSQYSQKQAEELREQLEERKRRSRERRQQHLTQKMKDMRPQNQNGQSMGYSFSFTDLWKRAKTTN